MSSRSFVKNLFISINCRVTFNVWSSETEMSWKSASSSPPPKPLTWTLNCKSVTLRSWDMSVVKSCDVVASQSLKISFWEFLFFILSFSITFNHQFTSFHSFFKKRMDQPRPLFCLFSVFITLKIQFLQQINVKNVVHPVYGAGIRTHDLSKMCWLP